jgi:hypothetical protein
MAGALNIFKTITANVTTTPTAVYSTPLGYSTVVLMAQFTNTTANSTVDASAFLVRTGNTGGNATLVNSASIPANDAYSPLTGRLIMTTGDSFQISASANSSVQLTLSILETLTG